MTPGRTWPKAVLFDLDGTLVDSAPDIAAALNIALGEAGHAALSVERITTFVGGGARALIERGLAACGETASAPHIDAVYDAFLAAYERAPAGRTVLYPGAWAVLEGLAAHGVKLGICTNKPETLTTAILHELDLARFFVSVVAARTGLPLKPAPDMVRKALRDLGVEACDAVMVGDSAADTGAARAAGVSSLIIGHGYNHQPWQSLGADAAVADFSQVLDGLSKVCRGSIATG